MENKTSKYFKYAIGEIVLVVIGILIALQINNWNENRIQRNQEHKLLMSLKVDFLESEKRLKETMKMQKNVIRTSAELIKIYEGKIPRPSNDSIKFYISYGAESWYRPELLTGAYDGFISNGKLELISNSNLTKLLAEYFSIVNSGFEDQENSMNLLNNMQQINAPLKVHLEIKKLRKRIGLDSLKSPKEDMAIDLFLKQDAYFGHLINRTSIENVRLSIQKNIFEMQKNIINILNKELEQYND